ncbi:MAG: 3'(2'),5'-bisphosphate nucleotidase CysQ [Cytophagaceae bacterium]
MILSSEQLAEINKLAIGAAQEAGLIIKEYAQKNLIIEKKAGGDTLASQVLTEVDGLCQEVILRKLWPSPQEYDFGLLTEEQEDEKSRFEKDYFWCIDPLDGTLPFIEKRAGYSVSIALVSKEGIPQTAVVLDPVGGDLYRAVKGSGAFKNGESISISKAKKNQDTFTLICDPGFSDHTFFKDTIQSLEQKAAEWEYSGLSVRFAGGAVMNALWVLENAPACYFKFPKKAIGGGCIWDYAATTCIYNELDAKVCDFNEQPLALNNRDSTFMNKNGVIFSTDVEISRYIVSLFEGFSTKD